MSLFVLHWMLSPLYLLPIAMLARHLRRQGIGSPIDISSATSNIGRLRPDRSRIWFADRERQKWWLSGVPPFEIRLLFDGFFIGINVVLDTHRIVGAKAQFVVLKLHSLMP